MGGARPRGVIAGRLRACLPPSLPPPAPHDRLPRHEQVSLRLRIAQVHPGEGDADARGMRRPHLRGVELRAFVRLGIASLASTKRDADAGERPREERRGDSVVMGEVAAGQHPARIRGVATARTFTAPQTLPALDTA